MAALVERRFAAVELRVAEGSSAATVEGVCVRYGDECRLPGFRERFRAGAFGNVDGLDVFANVMHDRSRPLACTNGGGLLLSDSTEHLRAVVELPPTRDGEDAAELLKRRVLTGFSIEFQVEAERFEADDLRIVEKAVLRGVSIVDRPAYGDSVAKIAARMAALTQPPKGRRVWL